MDTTKSKVVASNLYPESIQQFLSLLISIYFLIVHLFLSLVVLSLFVATILDNLEQDEDLKKLIQENMRKQIEYKENTKLPFRLRFYELFKEQPKLIRLSKVASQFETPRLKVTFMNEYLNQTDTELNLNNLLKTRSINLVNQFKLYNMNDLRICNQLDTRLDKDLNEFKTKPLNLINNYHLIKTPLRKHQFKLIQLDQLLKFSEQRIANEDKNEEFSKQIELLGDRWKELELPTSNSSILTGRRKSLRFDESALNETNDQRQLLGGKYEVKQRATSKALEILKHYLVQRSENSVKNQLKILKENHPFLNRSLFFIKRSNWLRKHCILIIEFKLNLKNTIFLFKRYLFFRKQFKNLNDLIKSLPLIDWAMIIITLVCCSTLIFENPNYSILNSKEIITIEWLFIITLFIDLTLKLIANGLFTPDSTLFNLWFLIDLIVLINSITLIGLQQILNFEIPLAILILRYSILLVLSLLIYIICYLSDLF